MVKIFLPFPFSVVTGAVVYDSSHQREDGPKESTTSFTKENVSLVYTGNAAYYYNKTKS